MHDTSEIHIFGFWGMGERHAMRIMQMAECKIWRVLLRRDSPWSNWFGPSIWLIFLRRGNIAQVDDGLSAMTIRA